MTAKIKGEIPTYEQLPPFPEGWYFVTNRKTLLREKLIEKIWMGEEIVAWIDEDGRICVADAFCTHIGSHMGPTVGGVVRKGCLVCPFHGFEFDTSGQCVLTPNAPAPKAARLKVYETREILGMVFAWWGADGRPPQWHLPDEPPTAGEWTGLRFITTRFRGHPQDTTENSVDLEHLGHLHGCSDMASTTKLSVDGSYLRSSFSFRTTRKIANLFKVVSEVSTVAHVHGLGYSIAEIHEKETDLHTRMWVLATPIDGTRISLTLAAQTRKTKPKQFIAGLRFLPANLRHDLFNRVFLREEKRYIMQDVGIWERKRNITPPRLSSADGPIGKYRRYCQQFYPEGCGQTGRT